MASEMPRNYSLFFHFLDSQIKCDHICRVLDYGCGDGFLVREGIKRGYHFLGVDNFYGNDDQANGVLAKAKVEGIPICVLNADGTIPWPDAYFDVILSNQVMEHVFDLDFVCGEMYRVLKRNGVMLHVFPTRERIMEGHIGVPIVHWFPKKHRFNELLILVARRFGFGFGFKIKEKPDKKWAHDVLEWLDRHVFYRNWQ